MQAVPRPPWHPEAAPSLYFYVRIPQRCETRVLFAQLQREAWFMKPGSDSCSHSSSALWLEGKGGTGVQYTLEGSAFAQPPAALESKEGCQGSQESDYLQLMRCEGRFKLCLQHAGAALAAGLGKEGGELWPPQELWEAAITPGPCLVPRELMQARHPGLPPACSGVWSASRAGLDPREPSQ